MLIVYLALLLLLVGAFVLVVSFSVTRKDVRTTHSQLPSTERAVVSQNVQKPAVQPEQRSEIIPSVDGSMDGAMYEDRDSTVQPGVESRIDFSSIERFKGVRRVASGQITVSDDSIDLRDKGKLIRYTFHRVKKIIPMGESALFYPDTIDYPMIVITADQAFSATLMEKYSANKG